MNVSAVVRRPVAAIQSSPPSAVAVIAGYVAIWLLEGAVRKWVPSTGTVLYIARDAYAFVAIAWLALTSSAPSRRLRWWVSLVALLGVSWAGVGYFHASDVPAVVFFFGLRSYVAPFLFVLLCSKFGSTAAAFRGAWVLIAAAPLELVLTIIQVASPPSAFVNVQVGGEATDFVNGNDVVRATGSFSAPGGLNLYLLLALAVALWWTAARSTRTWGWAAVACLLATCALSGARGSVLNCSVILIVYLVHALASPSLHSLQRVGILTLIVGLSIVGIQSTLPDVVNAFLIRFNDASVSENSSDRLLVTATGYLFEPFGVFGSGVGTHSNAGIALGSTSQWIENDNLRWVAELGVVGYLLALTRSIVAVVITARVVIRIRTMEVPSLLLLSSTVLLLTIGSVNQTPTSEGAFGILLGLLAMMAAPGVTESPSLKTADHTTGTGRRTFKAVS